MRHLDAGWYLAYWRVISADGHPVRGAFTFAVGPGPGPPTQFAIPSLKETAATPGLIAARWGVFLSIMAAIGLFLFRCVIARPAGATEEDRSLRAVTVAMFAAIAAGLVLIPVYVLLSTAKFSTLSPTDIGGLLPLVRISSFGRGITDLEVLLALFAVAAGVAIWLDRPTAPSARSSNCSRSARGSRAPRRCSSSPASPATPRRRRRGRSRSRSTGPTSRPGRSGSGA